MWGATPRSPHLGPRPRHRACPGHPGGAGRHHQRRPVGQPDLRAGASRPAGVRRRGGAVPRRAGGRRRRRPPPRSPVGRRRHRGRLRAAGPGGRSRGGHDRRAHPPRRQPVPAPVRFGDPEHQGEVVVEGDYEVGMQDQAFLGFESGLAVPGEDGGVELYVATQWLHVDRDQIAACLNLPREKVRLTLAGTCAPSAAARTCPCRSTPACWPWSPASRPRWCTAARSPSSATSTATRRGLVPPPRHPRGRAGQRRASRMVFDGGGLHLVLDGGHLERLRLRSRPLLHPQRQGRRLRRAHQQPALRRHARVRGGADPFAAEAQMDRLAEALGMDLIELRLGNALKQVDKLITGQVIIGTAPVAECIIARRDLPMPQPLAPDAPVMALPGGAGLTALHGDVRRGSASPSAWRTWPSEWVRRLLDGAGAPGARPRRRGGGHRARRHGRGRPGVRHHRHADCPPSWASTRWSCRRPTPRSDRPAPPAPRGRR